MLHLDAYRLFTSAIFTITMSVTISFSQISRAETLSAVDVFNSISYSGSTGTAPWNGSWRELGENNGASSGLVRVVDSNNCAATNCLRLGGYDSSLSTRGIRRAVNLSGVSSATIKFWYRRQAINSRGYGDIRVQASKDGASWTTLAKIPFTSRSDSGIIPASYDISNLASSGSQIRFLGSDSNQRGYIFIDNVEVLFDAKTGVRRALRHPAQGWRFPLTLRPALIGCNLKMERRQSGLLS